MDISPDNPSRMISALSTKDSAMDFLRQVLNYARNPSTLQRLLAFAKDELAKHNQPSLLTRSLGLLRARAGRLLSATHRQHFNAAGVGCQMF